MNKFFKTLSILAAIALFFAACAAPPSTSTPTAQANIATDTAPTATKIASPNTPASTATPSGPSWTYVAFGDSWPYGAHCNGCRPFPVLYADGLAATTDHRIDFVNLTTNGGTSQSLLKSIQTSEKTRDAIMSADIIVIATGGNDFEPAFNLSMAGNCGGADQLDCFREVAEGYRLSFNEILTEIEALRKGQPTAIRLVATSNEFLADPGLIEALGADFGKTSGVAITKMNRDVICEITAKHNAECVDLGLALNGPDLLRPQDVNTQEAMQTVADALLASGLDELH